MKATLAVSVSEIEKLFDAFNEGLFGNTLLRPLITIQTGEESNTRGWFSTNTWTDKEKKEILHEINIGAEILTQSAEDGNPRFAVTLLHEMIHLRNFEIKINDTSKNGYHHKKNFGKTAENHGLKVQYLEKFPGVITTGLKEEAKQILDNTLETKNIKYHRRSDKFGLKENPEDEDKSDTEKKTAKTKPLHCPECGYKIRVAAGFEHTLKCMTCLNDLEESERYDI